MPNANRVFPAGTGGNPTSPILGTAADLSAQPPIRAPPDPFVLKSVEPFTDDDNVPGFVDGQGNRIWHVDTSASAKAVTFVSAADSTDFSYVVKWTKGANGLVITSALGNVGGTATFVGLQAGDAYSFRSDGIEYHLVARVGDFVSSASFASQVSAGDFVSSNSLSAMLVTRDYVSSQSLSLKDYVSSNSLSVVIAGIPRDWVKIGSASISNVLAMTFSGSWTAYSALRVEAAYRVSLGPNAELRLSTDNGGTYFLAGKVQRMPSPQFVGVGNAVTQTATFTHSLFTVASVVMKATGIQTTPGTKFISGENYSSNGAWKVSASITSTISVGTTSVKLGGYALKFAILDATATANAVQVNQISFAALNRAGITQTMSSGVFSLFGLT